MTSAAAMSHVAEAEPREAKRAAFVEAARAAFFAQGYGATSMSSIAASVGGSKTTLWSHFRSKEELFAAVVDDLVGRYGTALTMELRVGDPVADTLARFGSAVMATTLSAPMVDLYRVVTGEAGRFPELARVFWERGPKRGKAFLSGFIKDEMTQGRLHPGDPMAAAQQFVSLCQSGSYQQVVLGLKTPDADAVARDVTNAVDAFMRIWAPR